MAPKKNILTLKEKMEVVNTLEKENLSVRALAKRFVEYYFTQSQKISLTQYKLQIQYRKNTSGRYSQR